MMDIKLIKENAKLIYKIASKYSKYYDIEDLFQEGVKGLDKARKNYDPNSNTKFSTYAFKYILGEIVSYVKNDRNIKVGNETMKLYQAYEKAQEYLTNKLNRYPTLEETCNFMGVNSSLVVDAIRKCEFTTSLESSLSEDDFTLEQVTGIDKTDQIDTLLDLKAELENLSEEERRIIELRYFGDYTQSEIANYLNMSQVQVSRSEQKILKKIKTNIAA
ncbi:MAG: sigma-70 family RNA polymerase sigma factor [Bacilli bacterium]|nr:sigma-70 family RNA polymerase sigma factor [Bacilli bacterium]